MSTPPAAVGAVRTAPATTGGGWDDPWGLTVGATEHTWLSGRLWLTHLNRCTIGT